MVVAGAAYALDAALAAKVNRLASIVLLKGTIFCMGLAPFLESDLIIDMASILQFKISIK